MLLCYIKALMAERVVNTDVQAIKKMKNMYSACINRGYKVY